MAGILFESWDHFATADLLNRWNSFGGGVASTGTVSAGNGRRGTQCYRNTMPASSVSQPLSIVPSSPVPSGDTFVLGMAFKPQTYSTQVANGEFDTAAGSGQGNFIALIRQASTTQLAFRVNTNGTISALRGQTGATLLGTTSLALNANAYNYIEFKGKISDASGTIDVVMDGVVCLSLSGIDTKQTGSATWDELALLRQNGNNGNLWDVDDLYLLDGTTSSADPRNNFLGSVRVDATYANANGNYNDSTPSGGAVDRYTMIDELLQDGDTTYNTFAAAGNKDSYNYPTAPVAGATIYAIQHNVWVRKEDAGAATMRALVRLSGTDYFGTSQGPGTSYGSRRHIWATRPSDNANWTDSDYNGAEFGFEKET